MLELEGVLLSLSVGEHVAGMVRIEFLGLLLPSSRVGWYPTVGRI